MKTLDIECESLIADIQFLLENDVIKGPYIDFKSQIPFEGGNCAICNKFHY